MASVATPTPSTKPQSGTPATAAGQRDGVNKPSNKTPGTAKGADRGRKESPVDQGRRAPTQKAWTTGTNPLTQKNSLPAQSNGGLPQPKAPNAQRQSSQAGGEMSERHNHDRLRFILGGAVGLSVVLSTKVGDKFEGLFAGSVLGAHNTKFTMKMVKKVSGGVSKTNGVAPQEAAFIGTSPEHAMTFDLKDVADMSILQYSLPEPPKQTNGTSSSFQTDSDISASAARGNERVLQKWVPEASGNTDLSLESGSIGGWDQFAAHKKRFGDTSTYDENMYTTTIDRSAPGYKQREAHAARKAQEILGQTTNNVHVREERGLTAENDFDDEEDKYSGVRRNNPGFPALSTGGPNRYVPPAQRPLATNATVTNDAPVDSAIISAQLSKPQSTKPAGSSADGPSTLTRDASLTPEPIPQPISINQNNIDASVAEDKASLPAAPVGSAVKAQATDSARPIPRSIDNPTEDVEVKVLDQFRQFAKSEKERIAERKRAQANQDRTAKLNDLLRFSKTFKLPFPVPQDLVGILARDPAKQEAIVERAQKEHEEAKSVVQPGPSSASATATQNATVKAAPVPKFDASQIPPPIPERTSFSRSRGGHQNAGRGDRTASQQGQFPARGGAVFPRAAGLQQDRRNQIPAPIILADGRMPPTGPMADQNNSPQRSNVATPTLAVTSRFNVKAMEFRPNANAPSFNPSVPSVATSSPASIQRTDSMSRAASPTSFFGARRPKADRAPASAKFNPIPRMKAEVMKKKAEAEAKKTDEPVKDYAYNGGIPNAYHTGPVWQVKTDNQDKSYLSFFGRSSTTTSPSQTRSSSIQHPFYPGQMPGVANGGSGVPQITTPQHGAHGAVQAYGHQFDDQRMHGHATGSQIYSSPGMASRQMSTFSSPMPPQAQLVYGPSQFYNGPGQMNAQIRAFPATPGMMHAQPGPMTAPMMVQQQSNGSYMTVPQHYNQMPMYSPGTTHVYPQPNGYPSPGRIAPMMMHQASQQGHHGAQPVMYAMPGQGAAMMYPQQGQAGMTRGGYGGAPYGSSPHQSHHMQHRAMSAGYGKGIPPSMTQNSGPPLNAPQQPAALSQGEAGGDDTK